MHGPYTLSCAVPMPILTPTHIPIHTSSPTQTIDTVHIPIHTVRRQCSFSRVYKPSWSQPHGGMDHSWKIPPACTHAIALSTLVLPLKLWFCQRGETTSLTLKSAAVDSLTSEGASILLGVLVADMTGTPLKLEGVNGGTSSSYFPSSFVNDVLT